MEKLCGIVRTQNGGEICKTGCDVRERSLITTWEVGKLDA